MRRRLAKIAILAVLVLALAWWTRAPGPGAAPRSPSPQGSESAAQSAPPVGGGPAAGPYASEEPSRLADRLNAPGADIASDLHVLNDVFASFRSATHGENPVGQNTDITAALTGRNPLGFAFIPPNHPAINKRGELCDRWGTPFFFHQESGTQMEIRSAGPDRRMWTAVDAVLTPGPNQTKL